MAVAWILVAVLVSLAAVHLYWALGGRRALAGAVPTEGDRPLFQPGSAACATVAAALGIAATLCGIAAGLMSVPLPAWVARVGTWAVALVFAARAVGDFRYFGFFKRIRGTLFARRDSRLYSPLCLAISLLAAIVAGSSSP